MSWRIELSPAAARVLRDLPPAQRRLIADRIGHLEAAGLPPSDGAEVTAYVVVPAGDHSLLCIARGTGPAILIAVIEPAVVPATRVLAGIAKIPIAPLTGFIRRVRGGDDELYRNASPALGGLPTLRATSRRVGAMDLLHEVRYAARSLWRYPTIVVLAVTALALGVGLPSAMYSLMQGALLRGLPVPAPDRIIHIERRPSGRSGEGWQTAARDWEQWRAQQTSFEQLAAYRQGTVALRTEESTDRYDAAWVTANTFALLGVRPAAGRLFAGGEDEPGAEPVAVLGHSIWRDRFASSSDAVGRVVFVNGRPYTVMGVAPEGFEFPFGEDVWLPLEIPAGAAQSSDFPLLDVVGRLKPGVGLSAARSEFDLIAARVAQLYPETNANMGVALKRYTERYTGEIATKTMYVVLAAVMLVLLVACTNVANLLLVRAVHGLRDLAVRRALGASRGRILRQLLIESTLLCGVGGVFGVAVAFAANGGLRRLLGEDRFPWWSDIHLDGSTVAFALALTVIGALLAGVFPALRAMRTDVTDTLKDEARGSSGFKAGRVMRVLVVVQLAFSLGLLAVTALLVQSVRNVSDVQFGFATRDVLTARVTVPESLDAEGRRRFYAELEERLATSPSVTAAALGTSVPGAHSGFTRFAVDGVEYPDDDALPSQRFVTVSDRFFETYGVAPTRGRVFDRSDAAGPPVAVVNERFAARYLEARDPIGTRIRLGRGENAGDWRTIVGVVPDLYAGGLDASADRNPAALYTPMSQMPPATVRIAVRTRGAPMGAAPEVRAAVSAIDPDVPVYEIETMLDVLRDSSWFYALGAWILAACGASALMLAAIGLYGVMAFSVGRRRREFGIRMALGAGAPGIVVLVIRNAALQIGAGVFLGVLLGLAIARGVSSMLFGVNPSDALTFVAVCAVLAVISVGATLWPAIRASRVEPLEALRVD